MAEAMTSFVKQRWLGMSLFLLAATLAIQLHLRHLGTMPRLSYLTGWVLFGLILALTLNSARKQLSFFPLLSSEAWLQFHMYGGLLTGVLFAIHVGYRVPTGWFEGV